MRFRDIINGLIFETYKTKYADEFTAIFGENLDNDYITFLDKYFISLYGNKTVTPILEEMVKDGASVTDTMDYIAFLLHLKKDNCLNVKEIISTEYDFTKPKTETTTETVHTHNESISSGSMDNVENTYGFNTTEETPESSTVNTNSGNTSSTGDNTKTVTVDKPDKDIQSMIDSEVKRKIADNELKLIFNCYSDILFISVYE